MKTKRTKTTKKNRQLNYGQAICEGTEQALRKHKNSFMIGVGTKSFWYAGNTIKDLDKKFPKRIFDIPISEAGTTSISVGAALTGMKPLVFFPRHDFMYYAFDPIINHATTASYMFNGKVNCPLTIRATINRGGEQGAQHSQSLTSLFNHIPGLKIVCPSTPYDAKGLMLSAMNDPNPVIYIDDRWLYDVKEKVPEEYYEVPIGKGIIRHKGDALTIVATSYVCHLANEVVKNIAEVYNINIELIDPRTIKPLDINLIRRSVRKTGKLLVIDASWQTGNIASEIITQVVEDKHTFELLKSKPERLCLPDTHAPASNSLEKAYYIDKDKIIKKINEMIKQ